MTKSSPLNAINVFEVSARIGSFQKAAQELCVTPGAVSRQIKVLEDHVGLKLFTRKSRRIELTKAGKIYYSKVGSALDVLHKASEELHPDNAREIVTIETPMTFAMHWLIPRINSFKAQHPDIEIQLRTSSESVSINRGVDLYIRRDPSQFSGLNGIKFMSEKSVMVCNPKLLKKKGQSFDQEIKEYSLITTRSRHDLWPTWFKKENKRFLAIENQLIFDNTILALQATIQGLGVAFLPDIFVNNYIKNNSLIQIPDSIEVKSGNYYYLESPLSNSKSINLFTNWLKLSDAAIQ